MSEIKNYLMDLYLLKFEINCLKQQVKNLTKENKSLKEQLEELLAQDNSLKF